MAPTRRETGSDRPGRKDLFLSTPCKRCPFRQDIRPFIYLPRVYEIRDAAVHGRTFNCHETVNYDDLGGPLDQTRRTCAGFLILAEREGWPIQIVQLAERLLGVKPELRGHDSVYPSFARMVEAHRHED